MRPLTEDVRLLDDALSPHCTEKHSVAETKHVFEKLHKYVGKDIKTLIDRSDASYVIRLQKNRVFYVREDIMRRATNVSREKLISLGSCIGKFTHSNKFRLGVGALEILSEYAKYKVWVRPTAEMQFLYGNHVLKSGLGRITEGTPAYTGVVVYSMTDVPLGFGTSAKSTNDARKMDPGGIVVFHQSDAGEYLRSEDDL